MIVGLIADMYFYWKKNINSTITSNMNLNILTISTKIQYILKI